MTLRGLSPRSRAPTASAAAAMASLLLAVLIAVPMSVVAPLSGAGAAAHPHEGSDAAAHAHPPDLVHENGVGPDPDGDGNPATDTGGLSLSGAAAALAENAPYDVIDFEAPPGRHGDTLSTQYKDDHGVSFGPGLRRQICEGQRRFAYDTLCTYEAAPSGAYAAAYVSELNAPFEIKFDRPICVVAMAIYPTGGKEGEPFKLTIDAWDKNDKSLPSVTVEFEWTRDTVRWRHMAGAYYLNTGASKIALRMESLDPKEKRDILRFLIDDLAVIETGCEAALEELSS